MLRVSYIIELATEDGEISSQSTHVDDLKGEVTDNAKRLEILTDYRKRLESLNERTVEDIDSLIKIAQELSKVQSDIEKATGDKVNLLQRIQRDIVNISFQVKENKSIFGPVGEAISDFAYNLSDGVSIAVTVIAYLLPWIAIFVLLFFILRMLWRKFKA